MTQTVTLENCDSEPIHIPGLVQPHGTLIAFDASTLTVTRRSANTAALLGDTAPVLGTRLEPAHFMANALVHQTLHEVNDTAVAGADHWPANVEVALAGRLFDLIVHRQGYELIAEFEERPASAENVSDFALKAHRAMDRLKRQGTVDALLSLAVETVHQLTGFDRVMAYRFRHDDSGEVVAERRHESLEPFVGRRYPASDIPAQARRLYVINTLRLIADVHADPVALAVADPSLPPLDMSHCTLRSVSPIHIEYLRNMGVGASMSISIVLNGRLWGMLACHHRTALRVSYAVRMACDVLAQVLSSNVQSLLAREQAVRTSDAARLRSRMIEAVLHAEDTFSALADQADSLAVAFEAQATVIAEQSRLQVTGDIPHEAAAAVVHWLTSAKAGDDIVALHERASLPEILQPLCGVWCGFLALRFDAIDNGWLVLARKEQIETISWGGKPEKHYVSGPLGPRLTPRGSFDIWKQTVRDTSVPWGEPEVQFAHQLRDELIRAGAARNAETYKARTELIAVLGHDLRDPLQSISMAAKLLERSLPEGSTVGERLGQRIQTSSSRMGRLIGQVLDASRLQSGQGLQMRPVQMDIARLLEDSIDESLMAYPGSQIELQAPKSLAMVGDPDRMAQLVGNLVSNARHHGLAGKPVRVTLEEDSGTVVLRVANAAPAIDPGLVPDLFSAFKRRTGPNERNKSGLGLGLHIAQAIVRSHGGSIAYGHVDGHVVFTVRIPR
ncbi:GAF domain-containing protein [Variovorax sp. J22P168]|uniref:ATP-binding protein n=1 Tax=Variovorax jilinensis TaxID=3053513 RepID=UPI002577EE1F|nr:ATP-binding protein [Variovorax sp. J22P168]MDM0014750.1 GAF domain-containing protein [Variovorax sp. J22P168]